MAEVEDGLWRDILQRVSATDCVKEQIAIVKEVFKSVDNKEENIVPVLSLLSDIFIQFFQKHQLKRLIISLFQSVGHQYKDIIINLLTQRLKLYYRDCNDRRYIDLIASLLDNFPLGETCIDVLSVEILQNISLFLLRILQEFSLNQSSVRQNELMHDSLASVQAGNRIIQKCFTTVINQADTFLSAFLEHDVQILRTAEFLVDCKTTCAMNVILLLKLQYKDFVTEVVSAVFIGSTPGFSSLPTGDNFSFLCLLYGTMSIVELSELVEIISDRKCLLLEYIFPSLVDVTEKGYQDSISKLLTVKCYNMWTSKVCSCMSSDLLLEEQKCKLIGGGEIIQHIMSFVWAIWEDSTDVIRIISREIFENSLKIHTMSRPSEVKMDPFFCNLTDRLMFNVSWSTKGKYGMLSNLIQITGTDYILQAAPDLPKLILSQMKEHALACHASELYVQLCLKHHRGDYELWMSNWINPLLDSLSDGERQQINNVFEYILTKLLKKDPSVMPYILLKLSCTADGSHLSSLVMCLRRARTMGFLDNRLGSIDAVSQLIDLKVLQQALYHINEQVRLDAFAFVCDSHKTTVVIYSWELDLIKNFLPWNLNSQSPAFRQQMISYLKKFLCRMKESETVLIRTVTKSKSLEGNSEERDHIHKYKEYLTWLTRHLLTCLHPSSSFARKTTCLMTLNLLVDIFGVHSKSGFVVSNVLIGEDFTVLIECLTDTFEDNKMEAYKLLKYCSAIQQIKQTYDSVDYLLETALTLAGSTRPQDSTTAAYLFKVLLLQKELINVMTTNSRSRSYLNSYEHTSFPNIPDSQSERTLQLLSWLMIFLKFQIKIAEESVMTAACSKPIYPTVHCIRYVMQDINFSLVPAEEVIQWKTFVGDLITSCLQISKIVSPVVQNSSPEGNIPIEAMGNIQQAAEGLMPEYLTVCCWRSIKEVSLVLGVLCTNLPVVDPTDREGRSGLLDCTQIEEIGGYYKIQLLESVHRGAFEVAYAGFVKMCDMLWRSKLEDLYKLPKIWLSHLMQEIQSVSSKLCATRRSAGVPFYVQALVTTEPSTTGRQCFKQSMKYLLKLALEEESQELSEAKVHSLNILRALYKDTRLGEDVTIFVAGGVQAAILGFKSKFWAVCNSSTLLFSALMTRIFGVKRSKDENNMSKKNCQTGKAFFHKYPKLYTFILQQLAEATETIQDEGRLYLHPSLYPLLMVLARLYPSPLEGTDTSLNLSAFIPYILKCSSSPVLRTRQISAKALQPMVVGCRILKVLTDLMTQIPKSEGGVYYSHLHGILLQMSSITDIIVDSDMREQTYRLVKREWPSRAWLLSSGNRCYLVKKEALLLTIKLVDWEDNDSRQIHDMLYTIINLEQNMSIDSGPGYTEYLTSLATIILNYTDKEQNSLRTKGSNSCLAGGGGNCLEDRLLQILNCKHYEVRIIGLMYLYRLCTNGEGQEEEVVFVYVAPPRQEMMCNDILSSTSVLDKLLNMTRNERHFECSKLLFKVLKFHPSFQHGTWFKEKYQLIELFRHCLAVIETCSRDDIRSQVLEVTGFLVGPLVETKADSPELLRRWIDMLICYKGTEQHHQLQLAVTKILLHNANLLLKDTEHYWGHSVLTFWDVLINLLQEDDEEVKNTASYILNQLNPQLKVTVHPYYGVDMAVQSMLNYHLASYPVYCWRALLRLISISEEEMGIGGRLFDKNEMNTWREEIQLSKIVTKYLIHIYQTLSIYETTSPQQPSETREDNSCSNRCELINEEKMIQLQSHLEDCYPGMLYTPESDPGMLDTPKLDPGMLDTPKSDPADFEGQQLSGDLNDYLDNIDIKDEYHPFKDVNKYIKYRANKAKLECIKQLCECLQD